MARHHQETVHKLTLHLLGRFSAFTEEMNRASLAAGQTASNLLYLALNYYRATGVDNGHGGVHGKRLKPNDGFRPLRCSLMRTDFTRANAHAWETRISSRPLNVMHRVFCWLRPECAPNAEVSRLRS